MATTHQRLTKYPLLLREILKGTPGNSSSKSKENIIEENDYFESLNRRHPGMNFNRKKLTATNFRLIQAELLNRLLLFKIRLTFIRKQSTVGENFKFKAYLFLGVISSYQYAGSLIFRFQLAGFYYI